MKNLIFLLIAVATLSACSNASENKKKEVDFEKTLQENQFMKQQIAELQTRYDSLKNEVIIMNLKSELSIENLKIQNLKNEVGLLTEQNQWMQDQLVYLNKTNVKQTQTQGESYHTPIPSQVIFQGINGW